MTVNYCFDSIRCENKNVAGTKFCIWLAATLQEYFLNISKYLYFQFQFWNIFLKKVIVSKFHILFTICFIQNLSAKHFYLLNEKLFSKGHFGKQCFDLFVLYFSEEIVNNTYLVFFKEIFSRSLYLYFFTKNSKQTKNCVCLKLGTEKVWN